MVAFRHDVKVRTQVRHQLRDDLLYTLGLIGILGVGGVAGRGAFVP